MLHNRFGFFSGHQQGENQSRQSAFEKALQDILANANVVPGRFSVEIIRPENSFNTNSRLSK